MSLCLVMYLIVEIINIRADQLFTVVYLHVIKANKTMLKSSVGSDLIQSVQQFNGLSLVEPPNVCPYSVL